MSYEESVRRFEELVSRYGHVIRSATRHVAGPQAARLADDAEQQVLLELWRQVANETTIRHPPSYLFRATVRETIRLMRQRHWRPDKDLESLQPVDTHPRANPERQVQSAELSKQLRRVASNLDENRRRAVVAHLAGFSVREVMEWYGWTYSRARNLIARGMRDFRQALKEDSE